MSDRSPLGVAVPRDDPEMVKAIQLSRETFPFFLENFVNPTSTQTYFAVKVRAPSQDRDEYIWITEMTFDGHTLVAEVSGYATPLPVPKVDEKCLLNVDDIYDWMIVDNGKLVGGRTIQVARANMTEENRRKFDTSLWFNLD